MPADPELFGNVRVLVADVLSIDIEDVLPKSNFFRDLGGESIDLLDLQFQVEKQLGIHMKLREMLAAHEWTLDEDKRFSPETRRQLAEQLPFLQSRFDAGALQTREDLFTIELIAEFVALAAMQPKAAAV